MVGGPGEDVGVEMELSPSSSIAPFRTQIVSILTWETDEFETLDYINDGVYGAFKQSGDPAKRAQAIVQAVRFQYLLFLLFNLNCRLAPRLRITITPRNLQR